jgi:hypothetical protein
MDFDIWTYSPCTLSFSSFLSFSYLGALGVLAVKTLRFLLGVLRLGIREVVSGLFLR